MSLKSTKSTKYELKNQGVIELSWKKLAKEGLSNLTVFLSVSESYKLIFRGVGSRVTIKKRISTIRSFTFCLWIKRHGDNYIKLFHLINDDSEPSVSVYIPIESIPKEIWTHFCLVYDINEPSKMQIYVDGAKSSKHSTLDISGLVASGRQIVLGDLEMTDDSSVALKGEITHFYFWTKALDESDINTVKTSCLFPNNVQHFNDHLFFKWSVDQRDIDMHGSVSKIKSDVCGEWLGYNFWFCHCPFMASIHAIIFMSRGQCNLRKLNFKLMGQETWC